MTRWTLFVDSRTKVVLTLVCVAQRVDPTIVETSGMYMLLGETDIALALAHVFAISLVIMIVEVR